MKRISDDQDEIARPAVPPLADAVGDAFVLRDRLFAALYLIENPELRRLLLRDLIEDARKAHDKLRDQRKT